MLIAVPVTLKEANQFVVSYHRHSKPIPNNGGKWAIGASDGERMVGVAIVGNPVSATYMDGFTAEVLRTCVLDDSPKGTCSFLYSRCWRAWAAMGGLRMITYTLTTESGASLNGAGWRNVGLNPGHNDWAAKSRMDGKFREWQPVYGQAKFRWEIGAK